MRYLCLIYDDEKAYASLSKADHDTLMADYRAFGESLQKGGHYVSGYQLAPTTTARTVRVRDGKASSTDGPYVETKEQLGGYYLIDARNLDEAAQIASRIPSARFGSVEVRPLHDSHQA